MAKHATSPESWIADRLSGPQQKFTEDEIAEALAVLWVIGSGIEVVWNQQDFETHLRTHTPT